jgi:predicted thioesterase
MARPVPLGARGTVDRRVEFQHTLTAWKTELPAVLSTPYMIGWMESAGFEALLPFCEGDEVSVGTAINVNHRAPAGIGAAVRCEAVLESVSGRFLVFRVIAQSGEQMLGEGTVTRAIVSKAKFAQKFRAASEAAGESGPPFTS